MVPSRRNLLIAGGSLAGSWVAGCTPGNRGDGQSPARGPSVVASFSILASVIADLTMGKVQVTTLVPAGVDAHGFDPPPSSVLAVGNSDLVVGIGLGFDPWMTSMPEAADRANSPVLTGTGLDGLIALPGAGRFDPHVWCAPEMAMAWVNAVATSLASRLPALQADVATARTTLLARLAETATQAEQLAEAMDGTRTRVVVAHDSFRYLARELGVEFIAMHSLGGGADRGGASMAGLIDDLKSSGARACFPENLTNPAELQELARQTGVRMGGRLYSDSLSALDTGPKDLPGLLASNLTTLARALAF